MTADDGTIRRLIIGLLRTLKALLDLHLETAKREASTDLGRVGLALLLFALSFCVLLSALLFVHLAAAAALDASTELPRWAVMLVIAGADLLIGLLLWAVGRARIRKPMLTKTRGLIRKTVSVLSDL